MLLYETPPWYDLVKYIPKISRLEVEFFIVVIKIKVSSLAQSKFSIMTNQNNH